MNKPTTVALIAILTILLVAPTSTARHGDGELVLRAVYDGFDVVDVNEIQFDESCGGGRFEILPEGNGFRFFEVPEGDAPGPLSDQINPETSPSGGVGSTGCGTASYEVPLPANMDHFHARFYANRVLDEAAEIPAHPIEAEQSITVRANSGFSEIRYDYFDFSDPASDLVFVDPPSMNLGAATAATVDWYFAEQEDVQDAPSATSGVSFEATILDPVLEFSYIPLENVTNHEHSAQVKGDVLAEIFSTSTLSDAAIERFDRINVRLQTLGSPSLVKVILPDGTELTEAATRTNNGPDGYDPNALLVERFQGSTWFTVPYGIVADSGAGEYTFVVQESQGLTITGALIPLAIGITILPLIASGFAIVGTLRFKREAFGGFQRAAGGLVVAIAVLLGYYLTVMVSAIITGSINRMVIRPFDGVAVLLYLQVIIAAAGFIVVTFVGRELYRITVPRKME